MSSHYERLFLLNERLFLLNRCLEQVGESIEQFRQEGLMHAAYAGERETERVA